MKKLLYIIACFLSVTLCVCAEGIDDVISDTGAFLINTVQDPTVSSMGGEWTVIGLKRNGIEAEGLCEGYISSAEGYIREVGGVLSSRKLTEYARVTLAFTAMGKDPRNIGGFDIVTPLLDYDRVVNQGLNGAVWAIIALNSKNYGNYDIKKRYADFIIERQLNDGGWALSKTEEASDPDVTAMALTALSCCRNMENVSASIEKGLAFLSGAQNERGGFSTYGVETAESTAQVIVALCSLGISPFSEEFKKNGNTLLDNLLSYYNRGEGFSHQMGGGFNIMATEQSFYALAALKRFEKGENTVFDMTDVEKSFSDISSDKNSDEIKALAARGIVSGMNGLEFMPDKTMTRAEFSAIIVKALELSFKGETAFTDVGISDWFYGYVAGAYNNGIVYGVSETEFNPQGEITVEEAAAMLQRSMLLKRGYSDNDLQEFDPEIFVNASDWAKKPLAFCMAAGIIDGEKTDAKEKITRSRMAHMVYNMLKAI